MTKLPKKVEGFCEGLYADGWYRACHSVIVNLLTHPDSPIRKLIEAANEAQADLAALMRMSMNCTCDDSVGMECSGHINARKLKHSLRDLEITEDDDED